MPVTGLSIAASKLMSLGLAAKVGVGVTVATASVAGAGAAGVLPDQANERARDAIEAVTPVEFGEPAADRSDDTFGDVVSSDATGESDGKPGVDGSAISEMAPGAAHRPSDPGNAPDQGSAPDATGLDQATETPAAAHVPDDAGAPADVPAPADVAPETAPEAPPVTLPDASGRPDTPGGPTQRD